MQNHFLLRSEEELSAIEIVSKKLGIYLKGLTGNPTNLSANRWLYVRTKSFKYAYGDWEEFFKMKFLLFSNPVSSLTGDEFKPKPGIKLTDQVEEYFSSLGGMVNSPFFGEVILDRKGVSDSLAHGIGRLKAVAYAAVDQVIEKGVIIDYDINHKNKGYNSVILAAPISIKEERYICEVALILGKEQNRFYLHEVTAQKKLLDAVSVTNLAHKPSAHLGVFAKVLQNIIFTNNNVIRCSLDENGEPLLSY